VLRVNAAAEDLYSKVYVTTFQYLADFTVDTETYAVDASGDLTRARHVLKGTMPCRRSSCLTRA